MRQVQIRKASAKKPTQEIDTRTPSGRKLPF